jgi:hypothetical protein
MSGFETSTFCNFLQAVVLTLMLVAAGNGVKESEEEEDDDQTPSGKTRHGRRLGKYKYKEEVIKRVEFNHPCRSVN